MEVRSVFQFASRYAKPGELLRRLLELLVGYPIYALSFLFPRRKNKWVFGTNVGFTDNSKYLFLELLQRGDVQVYWISPKKEVVRQMRALQLPSYSRWSLRGLWHCLTASVYVFTYFSHDINFFTSGRAKKVNLWHGVGIKNLGGTANKETEKVEKSWLMQIATPFHNERFSLFLSTSPLMNEHFQRMFSLDETTIFEGIYPRCAFLQQSKAERQALIDRYENAEIQQLCSRFQTYQQVFLYMPTWRESLNDGFLKAAQFDFERLNAAMKATNSLFVLKLHPAVRFQHTDNQSFDNVLFLDSKIDVYPILPFTTTLITDYSSIYYDYLLMSDKKVLLFPFDIEEYRQSSNSLAFDYEEYTPGVRAYSFDELLPLLTNVPSADSNETEKITRIFWGDDYRQKTVNQLIEKIKQC